MHNAARYALILNTPTRNELLEHGPPSHVSSSILGRGTFGIVFKAIFKEQTVAVKIIRHKNSSSLSNEAHILNWRRHRNIVQILQIESTTNYALVIMEHFQGPCLQRVLDMMQLSLADRIFIAMDMRAALAYCHAHYVLHLDVKPQNIMVCYDSARVRSQVANCGRTYNCKLCDFGASLCYNTRAVVSCKVQGTIRYMAPEALREEPLTPAADVYSLGITLWQLQSRCLPYHWTECNEAVAYQVVKHQLRPNAWPVQRASVVSNGGATSLDKQMLQKLSKRSQARRNLNTLFTFGAFAAAAGTTDARLEAAYANIYKCCWHSDCARRLNLNDLQKRLAQLLHADFCSC